MSNSVTLDKQLGKTFQLQGDYFIPERQPDGSLTIQGFPQGATTNGNGRVAEITGYNGALLVHVIEQAGGTATLSLQGSITGFLDTQGGGYPADTTAVGYSTLGTPPRNLSSSNISVTAHSRKSYLIVDPYPYLRAVLSAMSSAQVLVVLYAVPQ